MKISKIISLLMLGSIFTISFTLLHFTAIPGLKAILWSNQKDLIVSENADEIKNKSNEIPESSTDSEFSSNTSTIVAEQHNFVFFEEKPDLLTQVCDFLVKPIFNPKEIIDFFHEFEEMEIELLEDTRNRLIGYSNGNHQDSDSKVEFSNIFKENDKLAMLFELHYSNHEIIYRISHCFYDYFDSALKVLIDEREENSQFNTSLKNCKSINSVRELKLFDGFYYKRMQNLVNPKTCAEVEEFFGNEIKFLTYFQLHSLKDDVSKFYNSKNINSPFKLTEIVLLDQFEDSYRLGLLLKIFVSNNKLVQSITSDFISFFIHSLGNEIRKRNNETINL